MLKRKENQIRIYFNYVLGVNTKKLPHFKQNFQRLLFRFLLFK